MADLKVSSLQHLCRNWHHDPLVIKRRLLALAERPPTFSYDPLFGAVRDLLVFGVPYEQIVEGIRRGVKRPEVRENFLGVLPLIQSYFADIRPSFFQMVERRFYPAGRKLMIPFNPPLIYGVDGQLCFPWLSFWRSNPIADERLSLFVTLVEEVLLQDPDLERAQFTVLDFSAPAPKFPRELEVISATDVPRVNDVRKKEMLGVFVKGFALARAELLAKSMLAKKKEAADKAKRPQDEPDLFDPSNG